MYLTRNLGIDSGTAMPLRLALRYSRITQLLKHGVILAFSLAIASFGIFLALHYLPGDQAVILAGTDATTQQTELIREQLGLDRPVISQYFEWVAGALHGDLGRSLLTGGAVAQEISEKLQVTVPLIILALGLSIAVALPVGILSAVGRKRWWGAVIGGLSQLGIAVPVFVVGIFLVVVIAVKLRFLPAQGFPIDRWADPGMAFRSLILPALTLALAQASVLIRFVRSATIELLSQDWVRTARAQGWTLTAVLLRQGLRNAALPIVAVVVLELSGLLLGSVVIEKVFSLPGIGTMLLRDVGNRDIVTVQGVLLVMTSAIITLSILTNTLFSFIDPRLRSHR